MHMADALLSPVVGGVMTVVSAGNMGYAVKKMSGGRLDEKKIPVMGVMGAFVFAAQMVNFAIPGTGASGHLGGGVLLAAVLGPYPALITMAAILLIQCLLFADGGLLAYGCNVFNMGVCASLAYVLIFLPIIKKGADKKRITLASMLASVAALQIGAFCIVIETQLSGITALPFGAFAALMQPIHLAIGLVEGLITAAVLCYIHGVRPDCLDFPAKKDATSSKHSLRTLIIVIVVATLVVGCAISLLASSDPDGLEWSVEGAAGSPDILEGPTLSAPMPDYGFPDAEGSMSGTAISGIIGSAATILLVGGAGAAIWGIKKMRKKTA